MPAGSDQTGERHTEQKTLSPLESNFVTAADGATVS
jgi:hypothetical protein